jgi:hypothetical protein
METAELKSHLDQTLQTIETLESQIQFFKTENQNLNNERLQNSKKKTKNSKNT